MHYITTLCYIEKENDVLLMLRNKKKNDPNAGKWIGIGGKVEPHETLVDAMKREVYEETGFTVLEYTYRGVIHFTSTMHASEDMHLYVITNFSGTFTPCDEGSLSWINKKDIASLPMWEGDQIFIRLLTNHHPFFHLYLHYEGYTLQWAKLDDTLLDLTKEIDRKGK